MKVHVVVPSVEREQALAVLLQCFPRGFEDRGDEFAVYGASDGELPREIGSWTSSEIADDWGERWREFHHGREIGERFWIGPPWERVPSERTAIVIDPGQAFGTGAHATTVLCAELLVEIEQLGPVLDLGCGSGVLAICAAVLGHAPVFACDSDPLAVAATRENVQRNRVEVEVWEADALYDELPRSIPLWLANLELRPLEELAWRPDLPARLIVSGLLEREAFALDGYRVAERRTLEGWQALLLER